MDDWLTDEREICSATIDGEGYDRLVGDRFARIQYPGEYCFVPWLRVTSFRRGYERHIEAPLNRVEVIEFAPRDSGSGSQSEDAPQSAAEAEGPQSGGNEDCRIAQPPSSSPESTP